LAMTSHGAVFCLVLMLLILPPVSYAGSFGVTPIRLDLDRATKTGAIKISNDADDTLQVQMQAFEWSQDAEGKDHYEASADLIFFPKIMGSKNRPKGCCGWA
jgi:P pilus assembly chaperone PapD